jgi:hypothetical protein
LVVHNTYPGDILQTGGRTILKSTARALNEFHEVSLHSREWGRSLEKLKKFGLVSRICGSELAGVSRQADDIVR